LEQYRQQTEASHLLKPRSKKYRQEMLNAILKPWPEIAALDVRKISESPSVAPWRRLTTFLRRFNTLASGFD
jgi:hypothetical protein